MWSEAIEPRAAPVDANRADIEELPREVPPQGLSKDRRGGRAQREKIIEMLK